MTSTPASANKRFHLLTFGCQMNVRDSQWLAASLLTRGFEQTELADADFAILNTCSVREKPEQKVASAIRHIQQAAGDTVCIAILGCVAQQLGAKLFDLAPQIRLIAGGDAIGKVPDKLLELAMAPESRLILLDIGPDWEEREHAPEQASGGSAYITIMQGCNNFCSYCIVPFTRGREKSRAAAAILSECRERLEQGAISLTLLGQNVNAWRDANLSFADLLRQVAGLEGLRRLRFITPHPKDMARETIACLAELPVLAPCLHLPLQSGSDRVLAAMHRKYSKADYRELVRELKSARPDLALTTDLIVGFPGETEADFEQTLEIMQECGFMASYSFCYSDRPGARAALMPDKIPQKTKLARLARLQALQEELGAKWLAARVGANAEILLESPSQRGPSSSWMGRDAYGTSVHVMLGEGVPGMLVPVRITAAKKHCLMAVKRDS